MVAPKISVIVPVYNSESSIKTCIDSILGQTVPVYEIIVVNDGSNDKTEVVLMEYSLNRKVRIINQENGGPAKARNTGIRVSSGDWIAFIDADDRWLPEKIKMQIEVIRMFPDIPLIGTKFFNRTIKNSTNRYEEISFRKVLFQNKIYTSTVIVRRDVVTKYMFDERKRYSEDSKLWFLILYKSKGIVINDGLVVYAENKKEFSRNSLSGMLTKMEYNELNNYYFLFKNGMLPIYLYIIIIPFSLLKFLRRLILSAFS